MGWACEVEPPDVIGIVNKMIERHEKKHHSKEEEVTIPEQKLRFIYTQCPECYKSLVETHAFKIDGWECQHCGIFYGTTYLQGYWAAKEAITKEKGREQMELSKIRELKHTAEKKIRQILIDFANETDMYITSVDFDMIEHSTFSEVPHSCSSVNLYVSLDWD